MTASRRSCCAATARPSSQIVTSSTSPLWPECKTPVTSALDDRLPRTRSFTRSDETPNYVAMQKDGEVAVISVNNPPVNALSWHVREGLKTHFEAALADDGVKAIVLRCDGATFIAGADISEFGKPPREIGRAHV